MIENTTCAFPWEMYSIDTGFGWYRTCPRIDYKKIEDLNFNNHNPIIEQRQALRNNEQHADCEKCWMAERCGAKSYRQVLETDRVPKHFQSDTVTAPKILEIKFSNLCNLKCVFCSSKCSSLWERDDPIPEDDLGPIRGPELGKQIIEFYDKNYKEIEMIQLFGGEPILIKEFDDVFNIVNSKPLSDGVKTISFATNMYYSDKHRSNFEDKIETAIDRGHKIYMRFSMDGAYSRGEYLRTGMKWDLFERNIDSFMDRFHDREGIGRIKCNIALNVTNIVYLDEIMAFIAKKGLTNVEPHYNYVHNPLHFYVQSYGTRLNKAVEIIKSQNYYGFEKYKNHVLDLLSSMTHIEPNYTEIQNAKQWLDNYDKTRSHSFLETFPLNEFMFND